MTSVAVVQLSLRKRPRTALDMYSKDGATEKTEESIISFLLMDSWLIWLVVTTGNENDSNRLRDGDAVSSLSVSMTTPVKRRKSMKLHSEKRWRERKFWTHMIEHKNRKKRNFLSGITCVVEKNKREKHRKNDRRSHCTEIDWRWLQKYKTCKKKKVFFLCFFSIICSVDSHFLFGQKVKPKRNSPKIMGCDFKFSLQFLMDKTFADEEDADDDTGEVLAWKREEDRSLKVCLWITWRDEQES